jgi:chaperonin cofactor prefoldin
MDQINKIKTEIKELEKKINKIKNLSNVEKHEIKKTIRYLGEQNFFGQEFDLILKQREQNQFKDIEFKDFEEQPKSLSQILETFSHEPLDDDRKNIRKIYISLANRFHPDKSAANENEELNHKIMQKINQAYENNDIATLLEIQAEYSGEIFGISDDPDLVATLEQEAIRLKLEVSMLEEQNRRINAEIKKIGKSELGFFAQLDKPDHNGEGIDTLSAEISTMLDIFTEFKTILENGVSTGKIDEEAFERLTIKMNQAHSTEPEMDEMELFQELFLKKAQEELFNANKGKKRKQNVDDMATDLFDELMAELLSQNMPPKNKNIKNKNRKR